MMIVYGVVAGIWQLFFADSEGLLAVVGIGAAFFLLPASAYWILVLFFGEQKWPSLGGTRKGSRKD